MSSPGCNQYFTHDSWLFLLQPRRVSSWEKVGRVDGGRRGERDKKVVTDHWIITELGWECWHSLGQQVFKADPSLKGDDGGFSHFPRNLPLLVHNC